MAYYTDMLETLVGKTVVKVVFDDVNLDRYHGLLLEDKKGGQEILWILADVHGENPGFPEIEEVLT